MFKWSKALAVLVFFVGAQSAPAALYVVNWTATGSVTALVTNGDTDQHAIDYNAEDAFDILGSSDTDYVFLPYNFFSRLVYQGDLPTGHSVPLFTQFTKSGSIIIDATDSSSIFVEYGGPIYFGDDLSTEDFYDSFGRIRDYAGGDIEASHSSRIDSFIFYDPQLLSPTPTPEPAIWATMLLGFGAVGGASRRRRAKFNFHRARPTARA